MKKLFFSAVAVMFALAAAAQNKNIDKLVEKYTDTEGYTVMNLEGDAIRALSSMISADSSTIDLGNGTKYSDTELLEDISSVSFIVASGKADGAFTADVERAVSHKNYSTMLSYREGDSWVRVKTADVKRGKYRGEKEIVVVVNSDRMYILARVMGPIDLEKLAEALDELKRQKEAK